MIRRTIGSQCMHCEGTGRVSFTRKDGSISKAKRICSACNGKGITYVDTGKTAGFKISPRGVADVAAGGFKTDKQKRLSNALMSCQEKLKEFVAAYIRYFCYSCLILWTVCSTILITMILFILSLCSVLLRLEDFLRETQTFKTCHRGSTFVIRKVVKVAGRAVKTEGDDIVS